MQESFPKSCIDCLNIEKCKLRFVHTTGDDPADVRHGTGASSDRHHEKRIIHALCKTQKGDILMNRFGKVAILFAFAAVCFAAGTVNHILHTGEGVLSSALLCVGCICAAVFFMKKK